MKLYDFFIIGYSFEFVQFMAVFFNLPWAVELQKYFNLKVESELEHSII